MSSLCAVELSGAVDAILALLRQLHREDFLSVGPYWSHVIMSLFGLAMLLSIRVLTSHGFRHALGSVVMVIFFIALLSCCGGVLAGLAGVWAPSPLATEEGYSPPSVQNFKDNLHHPITLGEFRAVLVYVYPTFIGIFQVGALIYS